MHKSNVLQKYKIEKLLFYDEKYIEKLCFLQQKIY